MPAYCSNYNAQVADGAKKCPECGAEFEGEVQGKLQTICDRCGNEIAENAAFCANCGAVFNQYGTCETKQEKAQGIGKSWPIMGAIALFAIPGIINLVFGIIFTSVPDSIPRLDIWGCLHFFMHSAL